MNRLSRRAFLGMAGALGFVGRGWAEDAKNNGRQFSVAVLNDLHIVDAASADILKEAVKQVNSLPGVRFAVIAGDITQDCRRGQFELAKCALDGLGVPYQAVPGNHDVWGSSGLAYGDYVRCFGERSWVRDVGGWRLIGLDSCQGNAADVSIPVVRMAWLKKQLQSISKDQPLALFAHHPFNPHALQYRVRNADKVLALFAEHALRLVACGHWHGNQVETQNGVLFTTTACCSSTRENFDLTMTKGLRLFHMHGDQVETEFMPVEVSS